MPSVVEISTVKSKRKLPFTVYLKNGQSTTMYFESYTTVKEVLDSFLDKIKIEKNFYKYFGL